MPKLPAMGAVVMAASLLFLPIPSRGATPANRAIVPTRTNDLSGQVAITTSVDHLWMFITVAAKSPGLPLQAAFTAQYANPIAAPVNFEGAARLAWTQGPNSPAPLSVLVLPRSDRGIMFVVDKIYSGPISPGVVLERPIGIAHYAWLARDRTAPKTHAAFVGTFTDPCTECGSGGEGSSQCSTTPVPANDCSVTCNTGYYACCNAQGCVCCKPSSAPSDGLALGPMGKRCQPAASEAITGLPF